LSFTLFERGLLDLEAGLDSDLESTLRRLHK
jgi:hypothetical protein